MYQLGKVRIKKRLCVLAEMQGYFENVYKLLICSML